MYPPTEPATEAKVPEDSDMRGMWGPRPLETVEKANAQLDHLTDILEKRGIKVTALPRPVEPSCQHAGLQHLLPVWMHAPA